MPTCRCARRGHLCGRDTRRALKNADLGTLRYFAAPAPVMLRSSSVLRPFILRSAYTRPISILYREFIHPISTPYRILRRSFEDPSTILRRTFLFLNPTHSGRICRRPAVLSPAFPALGIFKGQGCGWRGGASFDDLLYASSIHPITICTVLPHRHPLSWLHGSSVPDMRSKRGMMLLDLHYKTYWEQNDR